LIAVSGKWSPEGKAPVIKLDILPAFGVTMALSINLDWVGALLLPETV
jgi:hypothetical protein